MPELQFARATVSNLLMDVHEVDESVVRGEKRHDGKCYAVAYVDLADDVVGRAKHLREFQERVFGDDFFDSSGDLRWNKYLYIVAGPKSVLQTEFATAKAEIEADKDYARKRVVLESELVSLLGASKLFQPNSMGQDRDVVAEWNQRLSAAGLDELLDRPNPRTAVVERITNGKAKRVPVQDKAKPLHLSDVQLADAWLSEIKIDKFRPVHDGKSYSFGSVTLVVGPNGTGKTSLLEAIEFLYCGHNRRQNTSSVQRIEAKLKGTSIANSISITSTTDTARLKARCLAWYNRDERTARAILDGFSRYNFLDTDAAFRISTDLEPNEISEDLSRLLVGTDAALTWGYLEKILGDVDAAHGRAKLGRDKAKMELDSLEAELKKMLERPSVAMALTESFRSTLSSLGWKGSPATSPLVGLAERDPLMEALEHLQILQSAGPGASTIRNIQERSLSIENALGSARELETRRLELSKQESAAKEQLGALENTIQLLDRWVIYVSRGFASIHQKASLTKSAAEVALTRLGVFASGDLPDVPHVYLEVPLKGAINFADEAAKQAISRISTLEDIAKTYGRTAAARALATRQLKEAAIAVLQNGHPPDNCPICRTSHDPQTLSRLIEEITEELGTPVELDQASKSLEVAKAEAANAMSALRALQQVLQIAQVIQVEPDVSATEVLRKLSQLRIDLEDLSASAASALADWRSMVSSGLSSDEYEFLWSQLRPVFNTDQPVQDTAIVMSAREGFISSITELRTKQESIRNELDEKTQGIGAILRTQISSDWQSQANLQMGYQSLIAMRDEFRRIKERVLQLEGLVVVGNDTNLGELQVQLVGASRALAEALSATSSETTATQDVSDATQRVKQFRLQVEQHSLQAKNLKGASNTLAKLIAECSLERATVESLTAIGEQINDVFSRIHAPHEYEYVGNSQALLQTSSAHEPRNLDQVSTGQRAAFALSVFLALNRTAQSAPPVLLIDDPIAHIDDLNALSFLDYLRDLAVNSKRQIFFATADTRVASLFAKKFSFLGDEFKTIVLNLEPEMPRPLIS